MSSASVIVQQTLVTAWANLKVRYRQSVFGFIWVIAYPLLIFGVQSVAFHFVLKIPLDNYLQFLAGGLIPWIFISQAVDMTSGVIVQSGPLINAYAIHPLVLVGAQICDSFFNFTVTMLLVFLGLNQFGGVSIYSIFVILIASGPVFIGVLAFAFMIALGQVYLRDLKFVVSFLFQILFYVSPIFYPREMVPEILRPWLDLNPLMLWIDPIRSALLVQEFRAWPIVLSLTFSLALCALAFGVWKVCKSTMGYYLV